MKIYSLLITNILSLDPILTKGTKFFNSKSGEQFFVKGVAYQPGGSGFGDPLSKPADCKRDVELLKELGANAVRVYEVYPENNHDECMKILSEAGIYLMLDLPTPKITVDRSKPSYDLEIYNHFKNQIDAFGKYDNTLAFFAGNEVNNNGTNTDANAYVKAALRDAKEYIKKNLKRHIPVGYANNDDADTKENIEKYFACGSEEERADFFGINIYRWCGKSSFQKSGYDQLVKELKDYPIPAILSEYGCNTITPRTFGDVDALYGDEMNGIFSGGIVYEFTEEENKYGLVKLKGGKVTKFEDFQTLKKQYGKVKMPKGTSMNSYKVKATEIKCPQVSKTWESSEKLPPTPSKGGCECMMDTLKCSVASSFNITKEGDKVGEMFGYLCSNGADCAKYIKQDAKKGEYGAFSTCSPTQKLSWAMNAVYIKNNENKETCEGVGQINKPEKSGEEECAKIKPDLSSGSGSGKDKSKSNSYTVHSIGAFFFGVLLFNF